MVEFRRLLSWCLLTSCRLSKTDALLSVTSDELLIRNQSRSALSFSSPTILVDQQEQEKSTTTTSIVGSTWMFRGHPIAYECRKAIDPCHGKDGTPVLLLNGFGMGSFHQHRLMNELFAIHRATANDDNDNDNKHDTFGRDVYGLDYLGQGSSWPIDCDDGYAPSEQGLRYCAETWMQQIIGFIENVVPQKKVHLVGNSVGGYLAVFVAAQRPDLVESVVLLNATPVWGLNLPFWSGHLPAPRIPKAIGRLLFDRIRAESTIRQFLAATYANPAAYDDLLVRQVQSCTENKGGHAAFASILWSPPLQVDNRGFYDCLKQIQSDVLLCFGSDDPWCKPAFGRRMLQMLHQRSAGRHAYLELSAVGHCPNHEAPRATALVISSWLNGNREFASTRVNEAWGDTTISPKTVDEIQVSLMDKLSAMIL